MPNIIMPGEPFCPLCKKRMKGIQAKSKTTGVIERLYVCTRPNCMISINELDPALGQWEKMKDPPKCTRCHTVMRVFFRAIDGYFKAQCPECLKHGKLTQVVRENVPHNDPNWSVEPE